MLAGDCVAPFHLITSLTSDSYFDVLNEQTKLYSQDFKNLLEPYHNNTIKLEEQNLDVNVAFHMSPNIQLMSMPPPPPHNTYTNVYGNTFNTKHYRRSNWKNNTHNIPKGCDNGGSNKSIVETDNSKSRITKNGYKFPYAHAAIYNNYRYNGNLNSMLYNSLSLTHPSANNFNKRLSSNNNNKKSRHYNKNHYPEDIIRRVHGLMDRLTSQVKFFQVISWPPDGYPSVTQLDQAIWDVFLAKSQTQMTYLHKLELWRKLYLHIMGLYTRYGLFMVGSTMSGLGTDNSDIDICLLIRTLSGDTRTEAVRSLEFIRNSLEECEFASSPEVIHAKVPILKFKDAQYGFEVDLNCNNAVGIRNTHLLHCYNQLDWRIRPLVIIVKLWAQANGINDAKNMTISSYSLALMVIHFLHCGVTPPLIPCLHGLYRDKFSPDKEIHKIDIQEELPPFISDNKQSLGELFLGFLQYYAYFNYETYAISVRLATRIPIDDCRYAHSLKNDPHQWKYLCIEEPFDLTNTARSVYDLITFRRIQKVFQDSFCILRKTGNLNCILINTSANPR